MDAKLIEIKHRINLLEKVQMIEIPKAWDLYFGGSQTEYMPTEYMPTMFFLRVSSLIWIAVAFDLLDQELSEEAIKISQYLIEGAAGLNQSTNQSTKMVESLRWLDQIGVTLEYQIKRLRQQINTQKGQHPATEELLSES